MSLTIAPSTSYEATLELGTTGLVGTLALGTYDGDTATQALATTAINEIGASGVYVATRTSPGTAGQYVLIWTQDGTLDPDQVSTEDLNVTSEETAAVGGTSNLYISSNELKDAQALAGTTFADDSISRAIASACRAIDAYKSKRFYPTAETRYYTADMYADRLAIDDIVTLTAATIDTDGNGTYDTTWTNGTDFYLDPPNAALEGAPYTRLVLNGQAGRRFPRYQRSVKLEGTFGWSACPIVVKQAAEILAVRILKRGEVPFGIMVAGTEAVAMARLGRIDPDVAFLLDNIPGESPPAMRSLQLG